MEDRRMAVPLLTTAASADPKESDFHQQQQVPLLPLLASPSTHAKLQVGLVAATTVSVGFVEACLHFDRRPIPLPFAIKYALANALPSAVWQTVAAESVAAACNVSSASLITSSSTTMNPHERGKRLTQLTTLRSVRYIAGSYGLAWSLWRLHTASTTSAEESGDAKAKFYEKVLRLAPQGSMLSEVSKKRHGDHITTLLLASDAKEASSSRVASAVDWASFGLMQRHTVPHVEERAPPSSAKQDDMVKIVEVELQDTEAVTSARRAIKRMTLNTAPDERVHTVAILPCSSTPTSTKPMPSSILETFDISINPLSVVLKPIAAACDVEDAKSVHLYVADPSPTTTTADAVEPGDDGARASAPGVRYSDFAQALLCQYSIPTAKLDIDEVLSATAGKSEEVTEAKAEVETSSGIVVLVTSTLAEGNALAQKLVDSGFVDSERVVLVISDESLQSRNVRIVDYLMPSFLKPGGSDSNTRARSAACWSHD
ncbi:hypothetical protein FI667_g3334, partial [Globisporangium splendens]